MILRHKNFTERFYESEKEDGFTLIELLVVILVIGILAAIAVPIFLNQRGKSLDASVQSDLKSLGIEMETEMTSNGQYPDEIPATFKKSEGNSFKIAAEAGNTNVAAGSQANSTTTQPGRVDFYSERNTGTVTKSGTAGIIKYTGDDYGGPYWDYAPNDGIPTGTTITGSLEVKANRDMCIDANFEYYSASGRKNSQRITNGCVGANEWKELAVTHTAQEPLTHVTMVFYSGHVSGETIEFRNPIIVRGPAINKGNISVAATQKFCIEGTNANRPGKVWHYSALSGGVKEGTC